MRIGSTLTPRLQSRPQTIPPLFVRRSEILKIYPHVRSLPRNSRTALRVQLWFGSRICKMQCLGCIHARRASSVASTGRQGSHLLRVPCRIGRPGEVGPLLLTPLLAHSGGGRNKRRHHRPRSGRHRRAEVRAVGALHGRLLVPEPGCQSSVEGLSERSVASARGWASLRLMSPRAWRRMCRRILISRYTGARHALQSRTKTIGRRVQRLLSWSPRLLVPGRHGTGSAGEHPGSDPRISRSGCRAQQGCRDS